MKYFVITACVSVVIFFGLWSIVIPEDLLVNLIENSLQEQGISIQVTDLKKGLLYDFTARGITLTKNESVLLSCDDISGKINPFSLFMLRLTVHFQGSIGGGGINGRADLFRGGSYLDIKVADAKVEEIPFFGVAGVNGKGKISGVIRIVDRKGEIKFSVSDTNFRSASFGGIPVPLDLFYSAKGAMEVTPNAIRVVSFTLEGRDIYARIKGDIRGKALDLTMEVMPDIAFTEKNPLFTLLDKYKASPGHYIIPVKSTLAL